MYGLSTGSKTPSSNMSQGNLFEKKSNEAEAGHLFFQSEAHADPPMDQLSENFFGEGEVGAAAAPLHSQSSAARIGYVLIGVGAMGLLIFATLIYMWMRDRSLHGPKRKYDGQSRRKVAPLEFPESPRVVIVDEEEVDDDDEDGGEGSENIHSQMQIV